MNKMLYISAILALGGAVAYQAHVGTESMDTRASVSLPTTKLADAGSGDDLVDVAWLAPPPDHGPTHAGSEAAPPEPFHGFPVGRPRTIDFEVDDGLLERLTPREWRDQRLDWLLMAAVGNSGLDSYEVSNALFDLPPLRYGYMKASGTFQYDAVRSSFIGEGRVLAVVPAATSARDRTDHVAHIVDRHRKDQAGDVDSIVLLEYRFNKDGRTATLTRLPTEPAAKYLTEAAGYHEADVRTLDDLVGFLERVDDVTYAQRNGSALRLGGRAILGHEYRGIGVQEVAAIWQSESVIARKRAALEEFIQGESSALESRWRHRTYRTQAERARLNAEYKRDEAAVRARIDARVRETRLVNGSGFSLDPTYDFNALAALARKLLEGPGANLDSAAVGRAAHELSNGNIVPWLKFIDGLSQSRDPMQQAFSSMLQAMTKQHEFQAARYDGELQGTEAGMILFYTDLLAKIWVIDFLNSAPTRSIEGFVTDANFDLSPIYAKEAAELPGARLWFGPTDSGFQTADDGRTLYFRRVATRVYSMGNNPLNPTGEVQTSAALAASTDWWDEHYEEIARFEPEYQRLNELMKWSLLIGWLNEAGAGESLGFLAEVTVDRSNWFPTWARSNKRLRFSLWDRVAFHEKGYLKTSTEAMPILAGRSFERFGRPVVVSGGVSLAPRSLFKARPGINARVDPLLRRSGIDYKAGVNAGELKTLDGLTVKVTRQGPGRTVVSNKPPPETRLRGRGADVANQSFERTMQVGREGLAIEARSGGRAIGELGIKRAENGFTIGWRSRDVDAGQTLALRASRSTNPTEVLARDPNVERLVLLPDGRSHAVRLRGSEQWMLMAPDAGNTSTVPSGWVSRVAAPESKLTPAYKLKWINSEALDAQLASAESVVVRPPTSRGLVSVVEVRQRGPPPNGSTKVLIDTEKGGSLPAAAEARTGTVHVQMADVPKSIRGRVVRIADRLSAIERAEVSAALDSRVPIGIRTGSHADPVARRITRGVESNDYHDVAAEIARAPQRASMALDGVLREEIGSVARLVSAGRHGQALRNLDRLESLYGMQPDIALWKGLAKLESGQAHAAASSLRRTGAQWRPRNADAFLDEVQVRLESKALSSSKRRSLESLRRLALWQKRAPRNAKRDGRVVPQVRRDAIELEFHVVNPFGRARPVPSTEIREVRWDKATVYRQDSPGLNNLDWNLSMERSVQKAVEQDLARLVMLPDSNLATLNPVKIVGSIEPAPAAGSANTAVKPVSQVAQNFVRASGGGGGDDDEEEARKEGARVYVLVVEKMEVAGETETSR